MEKSGEHVIPHQLRLPALVQAAHPLPPSTEKYILPDQTAAASLLKSGVAVIKRHCLVPALALAVHEAPLSLDIYIEPPIIVAAMLRKSIEAVIPTQSAANGVDMDVALDGYDPAGTCTHTELPIALL